MRLIVNHGDFPFRRDTRLGRAADIAVLAVLAVVLVTYVRSGVSDRPPVVAPAAGAPAAEHQVVLHIQDDGRWTLNGQLVPPDQLGSELARVFADRPVKVLFLAASANRPYGDLLDAADRARAAGITTVGFLPPTPARGAAAPTRP